MNSHTRDPLSVPDRVRLDGGDQRPIGSGLLIGRHSDCEIRLDELATASRRHARIGIDGDGCWIEDLGSKNGTLVNGRRLEARGRLVSGDRVQIGEHELLLLIGDETAHKIDDATADPSERFDPVAYRGARLTIGRAPENDLVLADPNVSRFHAAIEPSSNGAVLRDLDSRNGTRLDGRQTIAAPIRAGAEIGVGPFQVLFTGTELRYRSEQGAISVEAVAVSVAVPAGQILAPTSLTVKPGELIAIIGENGAGKSTLLKTLAGVIDPSSGATLINGEPVAQRLTDVGYVPQHDIVHELLTVEESLRFAAQLRLPDLSAAEIDEVIDGVLGELSLDDDRHKRIGVLSGGQRKRACIAVELLSRPSVLFLDEPASALDPMFETRVMKLLRDLADSSRAVVTVTHATTNLPLCDRVAVMARGGYLCYLGPPAGALEFFGVADYREIYDALGQRSGPEWIERAGDAITNRGAEAPSVSSAGTQAARAGKSQRRIHTRVLARRYALLVSRDRKNLVLLFGQVPVLGLLVAISYPSDVFVRTSARSDAATLLFILAITVMWLGAIAGARELVKERGVFLRERAVGVDPRAYLGSKLAVLAAVGLTQVFLLAAILFALRPLHAGSGAYLAVFLVLALSNFAAVTLGLTASALARTQEQATQTIPLLLVPQLLFGGSIIPLVHKGIGLKALASITQSRWSFTAMGTITHLSDSPQVRLRYGTMFSHPSVAAIGVLALFPLAMIGFIALRLERQRD